MVLRGRGARPLVSIQDFGCVRYEGEVMKEQGKNKNRQMTVDGWYLLGVMKAETGEKGVCNLVVTK